MPCLIGHFRDDRSPGVLHVPQCPTCQRPGTWRRLQPSLRRRASRIAFVSCSDCGLRAVLKEVQSDTSAARLFRVAQQVHRDFQGDGRLAVAQPLARSGSVLLFAHSPGTSPLPVLINGPMVNAIGLASAIGEWLATYHQIPVRVDESGDLNPAPLDLASEVRDLEAEFSSEGVHKPREAGVFKRLRTLALKASAEPLRRLVRLHGDAKPDNFLFDGETLVGIDIEGQYLGMPERDLAQFEAQLRASATRWLGRADQGRLLALSSAVAQGYRLRAPLDSARLNALRVICVLHSWINWRSASSATGWRWDLVFSPHVAALLAEPI